MKSKKKSIVFYCYIGIILATAVLFINFSARKAIYSDTREQLNLALGFKKNAIQSYFDSNIGRVRLIASMSAFVNSLSTAAREVSDSGEIRQVYAQAGKTVGPDLRSVLNSYGFERIYLLDTGLRVVASASREIAGEIETGTEFSVPGKPGVVIKKVFDAACKTAVSQRQVQVIYFTHDDGLDWQTGFYTISPMFYPRDGGLAGFVAVRLDTRGMRTVVSRKFLSAVSGEIFVMEHGGRILAGTGGKSGTPPGTLLDKKQLERMGKSVEKNQPKLNHTGKMVLSVLGELDKLHPYGLNWKLVAQVREEELIGILFWVKEAAMILILILVTIIIVARLVRNPFGKRFGKA